MEEYHCNFGLNPRFETLLKSMRISGFDESGDARVIELAAHPFFIATLFQPELSALKGDVHPLVTGFVRAMTKRLAPIGA